MSEENKDAQKQRPSKRQRELAQIKRLTLQIALNTAQSFLQGLAVAAGAAVVTKISSGERVNGNIVDIRSKRFG